MTFFILGSLTCPSSPQEKFKFTELKGNEVPLLFSAMVLAAAVDSWTGKFLKKWKNY
jgi:hypothetical protein